jgi:hypothetical protein
MIVHSFRPFTAIEAAILSDQVGIDYRHVDFAAPKWLCATAYEGDELLGMCCFEFQNWFNACFDIAVRDSRCITRRVLRAMFGAVFSRARRVTAHVNPHHDRTIQLAQRMGFQIEGYQRLMIEGTRDALVLGMLAEDCVFLPRQRRPAAFPLERVIHGQHPETA